MSLFPWAEALAAAARMGFAPDTFWRMSLKEWRAVARMGDASPVLGAAVLIDLMTTYPDREARDGGA